MTTGIEIIGVMAGSYFYWDVVWIPVRRYFIELDKEFCKIMNWG
jgi:hypothetical protein